MITRMLHTAVAVENMDAGLEFYKTIGFETVLRFDKPEPKAKVAHLIATNNIKLELWEFLDKNHPRVKFIRRHIAIESDNLEAEIHRLTSTGCELVIPIKRGITLIRDLDGNYIEISQKQ
jgi:catechol 2,3-dioxygenase-like lactoylglutathione lyase family enzyme